MTYTEAPVSAELLTVIWGHLWPRGKEECERNGLSLQAGFDLFLRYAQQGRSGILLADDAPILVAGIMPDGQSSFTWFQATDEFDKHALAITKTLRRNIKAHTGPLYIYSVLVHPKTSRWFQALGFEQDDWEGRTTAGHPLYRFRRSVCA